MQQPWIATIIVASENLPPLEAIFQEMNRVTGYETLEFPWFSEEAGHGVFRTPHATLAVSLIKSDENPQSAILPTDELIAVCKRAWHWPEAGMQMLKMRRQIAVAIQPEGEHLDALDAALLLTCLVRAVVKNTDAVGVYWNHAGKIFHPEDFLARMEGMNRQTLPVDLWVDFRIIPHPEERTITYATFGLERFSLMEMEIPHSPREPRWVLDWLFNLSHSVIENGVVLEDKQTFGHTEESRFWVSHERSAAETRRGRTAEVIQLHFDEPPPE